MSKRYGNEMGVSKNCCRNTHDSGNTFTEMELTRNRGAHLEGTSDVVVELERHPLVVDHGFVARLDDAPDVQLDVLADHRVEHVDDEAARQAVDVALLWQVGAHDLVVLRLLQEVVDGQPLVVGHGQDLDVGRLHVYMSDDW